MRKFLFAFGLGLLASATNAATCPENQFLASDGACIHCIYNATCDGEKYQCIDGFYDTGADECAACPPHTTCTTPDDFVCMPGSYMSGDTCAVCPQNSICDGGLAAPRCAPGFYKDKKNICISCAGHVCEGDQIVCCGPGYYLHFGGTCLQCGAAQYCPTDECVVGITCNIGAYANTNGTCSWCEPEYYCPRGELNYNTKNTYCNIGYYRLGNTCGKCPDGVTCVGTYPDNMTCPDGLFLYDDGRCMPYAQGDPGVSGACNPGYYDDGAQCLACPDASECTSDTDFTCNAGYWRNGNKCDICPANSTCRAGSTQISCNAGYWLNDKNECEMCGSDGFWCTDNIRHPCPEFGPDTAPLPDDHIVDSWSIYNYGTKTASSQNDCALTTYVTAPMGQYKEPYYSYSPKTSQYVPYHKTWLTANTGYYLDDAKILYNGIEYRGISACTNAPENAYYTDAGTPTGNDCPWICNDGYLRNGDTCVSCPAGYECVGGFLVCPAGQYASGAICLDCPNAPENAYYTNAGTPTGNDCPWICNDGYLRNGDTCVSCPAGYECVGGVLVCPAGQYASDMTCLDCPTAYHDRAPGNTAPQSINQCQIKCDGGTYIASANATTCSAVSERYWNGVNYTNWGSVGTRNQCPNGLSTIGYGRGADSENDCGRVLHFGKYSLRLRNAKLTSPALVIQYGSQLLYGDMSRDKRGNLRAEYNGETYSIYNQDID